MEWAKILYAAIAAFLIWLLYRGVKQNPEWLNKENLSKSFGTMGMLALFLIVFIGVIIMLLRSS